MASAPVAPLDVTTAEVVNENDQSLSDSVDQSQLISAAGAGQVEQIKLLLQCGKAAVDVATEEGETALTVAAKDGQVVAGEALLEAGADVELPGLDSFSSAQEAEENARGVVNNNTALICAAERGHLEVVSVLIEHGAVIDAAEGDTALILAAQEGFLSSAGVNVANAEGETPLLLAADNGYEKAVELLVDSEAEVNHRAANGNTALIQSAFLGHFEASRILVKGGAAVNLAHTDGFTPLMCAAQEGYTDIVRLLLENGANVDCQSVSGETALTVSATNGHLQVVSLLLESGADVDTGTSNNCSPVLVAVDGGHSDIIELLLAKHANIDAQDNDGGTALHECVYESQLESDFVDMLIEKSVKLEATESSGSPALMLAAEEGHESVIEKLLKHGAAVDAADDKNQTALMKAAYRGHEQVLRLLLDNGATATAVDSINRTASSYARLNNRIDADRVIQEYLAKLPSVTEGESSNAEMVKSLAPQRNRNGSFPVVKFERRKTPSALVHLAKCIEAGASETLGALRWKAPELIRKVDPSSPTMQSDVYSFGMCIVEAVTGQVPWGNLPDPVVKFHVTREQFLHQPKAFQSNEQWQLVKAMCAFDPTKRMKLSDAIDKLQHFAQEELVQERIAEYNPASCRHQSTRLTHLAPSEYLPPQEHPRRNDVVNALNPYMHPRNTYQSRNLLVVFARRPLRSFADLPDATQMAPTVHSAVEARDVPVVSYEDLVAKKDLSSVIEEAFGYEGMGILVVSGVPELNSKRGDLLPLAFAFANLPDEVKAKCELPEAFYSFGWSHGKENLQGKPDYAKGSYYNNPETNDLANGDQQLIDKFPSFYHPNIWPKGSAGC
ncbi:unnamed protein product [Phytophthora lilii]|uniref:Unnamed protein product n=1 Tax=Phytophthora lilii TaxID=2077276 RepID=A0A9W6UBG9_9STRA|nr:unnamed protein product [Phytophthora lilii]